MAILNIGDWTVDDKLCRLTKEGQEKIVQYRVMELLQFFATHPHKVLSKEEIAAEVWKGVIVSDDAIVNAVVKLRKALGDTSKAPKYIETIPKVGYRFIAEITNVPESSASIKPSVGLVFKVAIAFLFVIALMFIYRGQEGTPERISIDKSLVVLPLLNLSGGKENDYFADGLTEELINTFSQQTQFRVVARTSSFAFKNTEQPIALIAEQLDVRYLIQGSIRRYQDSVKISIQLIDSRTLEQLLSLDFDERMSEILVMQERIAVQVTRSLSQVFPLSLINKTSSLTNNINANDLFWLGHYQLKKRTVKGIDDAIGTFSQLIAAFGAQNSYLTALAEAYLIKVSYTSEGAEPLLEKARDLLESVDEQANDKSMSQEIWGLYYLTVSDYSNAVEILERVAKVQKNNARARMWLGNALQNQGNLVEARAWLDAGRKLDPLNPTLNRLLARNMLRSGEYAEGVDMLIRSISFEEDSAQLELELARWAFNYQRSDGLKWATIAYQKEPDQIESRIALAFAHLQQGNLAEASYFLDEVQASAPDNAMTYNATVNFYLFANQREQLITYVNEQLAEKGVNTIEESPSFRLLWQGVTAYYQQNYDNALAQLTRVLNNQDANPIEQVEALIYMSLVYRQLGNTIEQDNTAQRALAKINSLKEKGWGMPYLLASQYVIYALQQEGLLRQQITQKNPNLVNDFTHYIQMHDVSL